MAYQSTYMNCLTAQLHLLLFSCMPAAGRGQEVTLVPSAGRGQEVKLVPLSWQRTRSEIVLPQLAEDKK